MEEQEGDRGLQVALAHEEVDLEVQMVMGVELEDKGAQVDMEVALEAQVDMEVALGAQVDMEVGQEVALEAQVDMEVGLVVLLEAQVDTEVGLEVWAASEVEQVRTVMAATSTK